MSVGPQQLLPAMEFFKNLSSPINQTPKKQKTCVTMKTSKTSKTIKNEMKVGSKEEAKESLITKILQHIGFQILITLVTILSLTIEDVRTIFIKKEHDMIIDIMNLVFMFCFTLEVVMSLSIKNYPCSFFFFLDVIATVTILMDVSFITDIFYQTNQSFNLSLLIVQSKASRAASRIVRVMKIFRLTRVVKLYKSAIKTKEIREAKKRREIIRKKRLEVQRRKSKDYEKTDVDEMRDVSVTDTFKKSDDNNIIPVMNMLNLNVSHLSKSNAGKHILNAPDPREFFLDLIKEEQSLSENSKLEDEEEDEIQSEVMSGQIESNISKILSDSTMKKIIIIILLIMFSAPILNSEIYYPEDTSWKFIALYVANLLQKPQVSISTINSIIEKQYDAFLQQEVESRLVSFMTPFQEITSYQFGSIEDQRFIDLGIAESLLDMEAILRIRPNLTVKATDESNEQLKEHVSIVLSYHTYNQYNSWFSLGKVLFICVTIMYLLNSFNSQINSLIVSPIEGMIELIKNPGKRDLDLKKDQDADDDAERYETKIVEKAIIEIQGLMSLILGKIGSELLNEKIFQQSSVSNYLKESRNTFGIYSLCKVQRFTPIMELLDEAALTFINRIADIVHTSVYRYGGDAVKNYSDSILVVFLLPRGEQDKIFETQFAHSYSKVKTKRNNYLNVLSDFSVYSMVKTIVRVNKETSFMQYRKDQRLLQKFGTNFQITLSCALTMGWTYQGIIGSNYKIDLLYIGNKINELKAMTKLFSQDTSRILLGNDLFNNLSGELQKLCRVLSDIKFKDSEEITSLYMIDMDLQNISPSKSKVEKSKNKTIKLDLNMKKEINMDYLKDETEISNYNALTFIGDKKQLREVLKKAIPYDIKQRYAIAYDFYKKGEWNEAKSYFDELFKLTKEDEPSKRVYSFLEKNNFVVPPNWEAYQLLGQISR